MMTRSPEPDRRVLSSVRRCALGLMICGARCGGWLACLATLAGSLGGLWWVFDLLSHFRVHYAVILALSATGLLLFKPRNRCLVPLAGLLFTLGILWGSTRPVPQIARIAAPTQLLSINVYAGNRQLQKVEDYVRQVDPDVLVLLEVTPRWQAVLDRLCQRYPHHTIRTGPQPFGIAVFSRVPVESSQVLDLGHSGVPAVSNRMRLNGQPLELLAVHTLPPISARSTAVRNRQLADVAEYARRSSSPLIVIGDLNLTPWSIWFRRLLEHSCLLDTRNGFGRQPTWPARAGWLGIPIDHCLVSAECVIDWRSCGPDLGSDHLPILCRFGLRVTDEGSSD